MEDHQIVELFWSRSEAAIAETDRKYGALCRQIAMIVGGRIWVDSAYTGGARFVFAHPIGIDPGGENREGGGFLPLNSASPSL